MLILRPFCSGPRQIVTWKDTAASTSSAISSSGSPFLDLPVDVLDKIFATDLEPQDHLALSGVCKSLRNVYSVAVICVSDLLP